MSEKITSGTKNFIQTKDNSYILMNKDLRYEIYQTHNYTNVQYRWRMYSNRESAFWGYIDL